MHREDGNEMLKRLQKKFFFEDGEDAIIEFAHVHQTTGIGSYRKGFFANIKDAVKPDFQQVGQSFFPIGFVATALCVRGE